MSFYWPLASGNVYLEQKCSVVTLDAAQASGARCASRAMLKTLSRRGDLAPINTTVAKLGERIAYNFESAPAFKRSEGVVKRPLPSGRAPTEPAPQLSTWAAAILASDEALLRPDAAAMLLSTQSEATISTAKALALLGALPVETYHNQLNNQDDKMSMDATEKAMIRTCEHMVASLSLRGDHGDTKAKNEATRIQNALSAFHNRSTPLVEALRYYRANVDEIAAATKRRIAAANAAH